MKTTKLVATLAGALVLLSIQPVFAQSDNDSIAEIGSGAWGSADPVDSDNVPPPSYAANIPPSEETWGDSADLVPTPKLPAAPGPAYSYQPIPPLYGDESTPPLYGDEATPPLYGAINPSYDGNWGDGSVLAPAPEQPEESPPESTFVPQGPVGLIERPGLTPISPSSPELLPPDAFARPAGGFHSTVGGFDGRFH